MERLIEMISIFNKNREWEQFHSPKNLSMALSVEVAEIVEQFQWKTQEQSKNLDLENINKLKEEIGDIIIYTAILADKFKIDPIEAAKEKIEKNRIRYPVDRVKGKSLKYLDYD